jgi:glycosyltransferase involved in cell wall biosynthesis
MLKNASSQQTNFDQDSSAIANRIVFISKSITNPSTRYRIFDFYPYWQQAGWDVSHWIASSNPFVFMKILKAARQAECVVVLRKTFNGPLLYFLRKFSKKLVFDFDDAIFANDDGSPSPLREKRFEKMMRCVDEVWAGNHYLAERAERWCQHTKVLPTSVEPSRYASSLEKPLEKPKEFFDVVWIGSRSTRRYLEGILPIMEQAAKHIPDMRLKVVADFSLESDRLNILSIPWSIENETKELITSHVGIAPLIDNTWTRGKCALKVVQYMAAGLPVVSSAVGANQELVIPNKTGFLADNPDAWVNALKQLKENPSLCESLGSNARNHVISNYSLQATFQKMCAELD